MEFISSGLVISVLMALVVLSGFAFLAKQYKRCASNQILVKFGSGLLGSKVSEVYHGGGTLVIPLLQSYAYLSLEPMTIDIPLKQALSKKNIRVNVPANFTVAISRDDRIRKDAAERLLGLGTQQIKEQAAEIIYGQLRDVIATMTIEEINSDRNSFISKVEKSVGTELEKIGLEVINVNITDITDESGYITAIGKKAAEEAIQQANIDVAEKQRDGAVGVETATKDKEIKVANQRSQKEIGTKEADRDQRIQTQQLEAQAVESENKSKADIANSQANLRVAEAEANRKGEVAHAEAQRLIFEKQKEERLAMLQKEQLAQEEVEKQKRVVQAEAQAEYERTVAKGKADAVFLQMEAEAKGIKAQLDAKAEGYQNLVKSAGNSETAVKLLLVEKLESLAEKYVEAFSNIQIDKITVWDNKDGKATSNFVQQLVQSAPQLHSICEQAGLELPSFLGKISDSSPQVSE